MPEDLKLSQIGYPPQPPPSRGLHSPGVRKHCQMIFACYFRKSSIPNNQPHCIRGTGVQVIDVTRQNVRCFTSVRYGGTCSAVTVT